MAALKLKEDATTGQLTLYSPVTPRLGGLAFGLIWLAAAAFFIIPFFSDGQGDLGAVIFFLVFAGLPALTSLFGALTDTTVVVDRNSRTISITKRLLTLPYSSQSLAFNDVVHFELQHIRTNSRTYWQLYAVGRGDKRTLLNWNGTKDEITSLADKISAMVGAPVASGTIKLPAALEQVLEKVAPNAKEMIEQAQVSEEPPLQPDTLTIDSTPAAQPVSDTLSTRMPSPAESTPVVATTPSIDATPTDLNSMSIQALEQRVASDPMDSDARYALAKKYHARGQMDKAIGLYQETMRIDPMNSNAQNDLGVALQQRGKRTEAEAAYRRAIALDPFSTTAHLNLGLLLRSMNRATEASQEFFQARQNARGDAETRLAESASTGAKIEPQMSKT